MPMLVPVTAYLIYINTQQKEDFHSICSEQTPQIQSTPDHYSSSVTSVASMAKMLPGRDDGADQKCSGQHPERRDLSVASSVPSI